MKRKNIIVVSCKLIRILIVSHYFLVLYWCFIFTKKSSSGAMRIALLIEGRFLLRIP